MANIKLGDLLVKANVLNESQLKSALAEQQKWGGKLGEILVSRVTVTRQTRTMVFISADIVCGERIVGVATGLWKIG